MKVIVAGSRTASYEDVVIGIRAANFELTEVVSGTARGADKCGERYARVHKIPMKEFPAKWNKYGRGAGPIRNHQMAEYADALIAIWDGESRGTKNMIQQATNAGLKVYVHKY